MYGSDIFNMALEVRRQMNAEMRHVALASEWNRGTQLTEIQLTKQSKTGAKQWH